MNSGEVHPGAHRVRCPGCGRDNLVPAADGPGANPGAAVCSRCECELGPLIRIGKLADHLVDQSLQALQGGRHERALRLAEEAWQLRRLPHAACCGLLASVLLRDPARIRTWSRRQGGGPGGWGIGGRP